MAVFWNIWKVSALCFITPWVTGQFMPPQMGPPNFMAAQPQQPPNFNPGLMGPPNGNPNVLDFMKSYIDVFDPKTRVLQPPAAWQNWFQRYDFNISRIQDKCPPNGLYATWNPDHISAVRELASLYEDTEDPDHFLEFSQFAKSNPRIHPHVWFASFLKAHKNRLPTDITRERPSPIDLFPTVFFPAEVLRANQPQSRKKRQLFTPFGQGFGQPRSLPQSQPQPAQPQPSQSQSQCVLLDERWGQDNGAENALWYFREDIQLNAHHWTWHLLFPTTTRQPISRRGEFFAFFHHDMLGRYTTERICNGFPFPTPTPLNIEFNGIIEEGYNPHLVDGISTLPWAPRPANIRLRDGVGNNQEVLSLLRNLTILRDRLVESISSGTAIRGDGQRIAINNADNINIIGELTEASVFSLNPFYYGSSGFHNDGHWVVANIIGNFPRGTLGVMGHSALAMRDMAFFRWHKLIDNLFMAYKAIHLPRYDITQGAFPLLFQGIRITGINVIPDASTGSPNLLHTFWNIHRFNVEGGLDFNAMDTTGRPRNIQICAKHLDHEEFSYQINIANDRPSAAVATVRIFLAPRFRSASSQDRFTFEEQRSLFFTMDIYPVTLQPGNNVVTRRSIDSTVSAMWPRSIQELRQDIQSGRRAMTDCGCGFPHHLLLPKGTEQGMAFDLFVMITDGTLDQVNGGMAAGQSGQCSPSFVHCGVTGRDYPDARPMGYPFDRRAYLVQNQEISTLDEYVGNVPNMASALIAIQHQNVQVAGN